MNGFTTSQAIKFIIKMEYEKIKEKCISTYKKRKDECSELFIKYFERIKHGNKQDRQDK